MHEIFHKIITVLPVLTPLVIGLLAAFIAYQQWRTNHLKLKFDLFKERLLIYDALMEFVMTIAITHKVDDNKLFEFNRLTRNASFYYDDEIAEYIRTIYDKAAKLIGIQMSIVSWPIKDQNIEPERQKSEMLRDMNKQVLIAKDKFKKFLTLNPSVFNFLK